MSGSPDEFAVGPTGGGSRGGGDGGSESTRGGSDSRSDIRDRIDPDELEDERAAPIDPDPEPADPAGDSFDRDQQRIDAALAEDVDSVRRAQQGAERQSGRVGEQASDLEGSVLDANPGLDREDVRITREGDRLRAELTATGREALAPERREGVIGTSRGADAEVRRVDRPSREGVIGPTRGADLEARSGSRGTRTDERAGDFQLNLPGTDESLEETVDDTRGVLSDAASDVGGAVERALGGGPAGRAAGGLAGGVASIPAEFLAGTRAADEAAESAAFAAEGGVNDLLGTEFGTFATDGDPAGFGGRSEQIGEQAEAFGERTFDTFVDVTGDGSGDNRSSFFEFRTERLDDLTASGATDDDVDPLFRVNPGAEEEFGDAFARGVGASFGASAALSGVTRLAGPRAGRAVDLAVDPGQATVAGARFAADRVPTARIRSRVRRETSEFLSDERALSDGGQLVQRRTGSDLDGATETEFTDPDLGPDVDPRTFERGRGRGPDRSGGLGTRTSGRRPRDFTRRQDFAEEVRDFQRQAERSEVRTDSGPLFGREAEAELPDATDDDGLLSGVFERGESTQRTGLFGRERARSRGVERGRARGRAFEGELERELARDLEGEAEFAREFEQEAEREREFESELASELERESELELFEDEERRERRRRSLFSFDDDVFESGIISGDEALDRVGQLFNRE